MKEVVALLVHGAAPSTEVGTSGFHQPSKLTPHGLSSKHCFFPADRTSRFFPVALHKSIDNFAWRLSLHMLEKYWPSLLQANSAILKVADRLDAKTPLISTNGQYSFEISGGKACVVKLVAERKGWETLWELKMDASFDLHELEVSSTGFLVARNSSGTVLRELQLSRSPLSTAAVLIMCNDGTLVLMDDYGTMWSAGCQQDSSCQGLHHRRWPIRGLLLKYNQFLFNMAEREYRRRLSERDCVILGVGDRPAPRTFIDVGQTAPRIRRSLSL